MTRKAADPPPPPASPPPPPDDYEGEEFVKFTIVYANSSFLPDILRLYTGSPGKVAINNGPRHGWWTVDDDSTMMLTGAWSHRANPWERPIRAVRYIKIPNHNAWQSLAQGRESGYATMLLLRDEESAW